MVKNFLYGIAFAVYSAGICYAQVKAPAAYIKLRALRNTEGGEEIGYAEVDVITQ